MRLKTFLWVCAGIIAIGIFEPVHAWLHHHLGFLLGIVIGSWLELAVCDRWDQWLWDRFFFPLACLFYWLWKGDG